MLGPHALQSPETGTFGDSTFDLWFVFFYFRHYSFFLSYLFSFTSLWYFHYFNSIFSFSFPNILYLITSFTNRSGFVLWSFLTKPDSLSLLFCNPFHFLSGSHFQWLVICFYLNPFIPYISLQLFPLSRSILRFWLSIKEEIDWSMDQLILTWKPVLSFFMSNIYGILFVVQWYLHISLVIS